MPSATDSASPLPTRPVDPVVPTLILADPIDINTATKIQRSFANLIRQLHRVTLDVRAAPRVIKFSDLFYRYLFYHPDASEDEPLSATTILEVSRDVLGSRHALAAMLHPAVLDAAATLFPCLRNVLRLFDDSLVARDGKSIIANLIRALAAPDDIGDCLTFSKRHRRCAATPSLMALSPAYQWTTITPPVAMTTLRTWMVERR
jgi:hypothetical protein